VEILIRQNPNAAYMANSFLDYYKIILQKVSFDQALFRKELNKALNTLEPRDATELRSWLNSMGLVPHATDKVIHIPGDDLIRQSRKSLIVE
jgi:hypothetical protein